MIKKIIKKWVIKWLGIEKLSIDTTKIDSELSFYKGRQQQMYDTQSLILDHIKFLNDNFDVGADIDRHSHNEMEGKVIIFYRGNERQRPEVKEIYFTHHQYPDLVRILQGFGKNSTVDSPMNFRNIDFKY